MSAQVANIRGWRPHCRFWIEPGRMQSGPNSPDLVDGPGACPKPADWTLLPEGGSGIVLAVGRLVQWKNTSFTLIGDMAIVAYVYTILA